MPSSTIKPDPFYDRKVELAALDRAWKRHGNGGQMLLLYGRRRLGKTFLLQRYFTAGTTGNEPAKPHCYYLAEQSTAAAQQLTLARQLIAALPAEGVTAEEIAVSWNALLRYASQQAQARKKGAGRFTLILDEFPYLVAQTPELPSILQAWWDREGVHSPLFVVLCGSQLSAMAALGEESAPLFGRFNAGIFHLDPLQYEDVACFYANSPHYGVVEKLLMYGVFGGTPRYHALVDPSRPPAEEIVTLLMQPRAILENEVRFLLGSEQIRDPAPYNAILAAIAGGETKFNGIQQLIGVERGALSKSLRTLLELGWIRRELPFDERSDRRALYRVADPFLAFWYRFVAPLASDLQFSDPAAVYAAHVAPRLADYMGWSVFEEICGQWLQRHAKQRLGLTVRQMARYWSRDGRTEIDLVAELDHGAFLFGECKWRADSVIRLSDLSSLQAKIASLPEARWRNKPSYVLFALGGFSRELQQLAADSAQRIFLVSAKEMLTEICAPDDLQNIKDALRENRCRAADILPTAGVGIYALYLSDPDALGGIEVDSSRPLYVGMTEDSQEERNHFGHRDSSFSSPRRSLGAILKKECGLTAIPRGSGKSAKDMTCYRFAGDGEQKLTNWMVEHLEYSFVALDDGIRDVERALIQCLQPPLNLDKWKNPQRVAIRRLRNACADEARRAATP